MPFLLIYMTSIYPRMPRSIHSATSIPPLAFNILSTFSPCIFLDFLHSYHTTKPFQRITLHFHPTTTLSLLVSDHVTLHFRSIIDHLIYLPVSVSGCKAVPSGGCVWPRSRMYLRLVSTHAWHLNSPPVDVSSVITELCSAPPPLSPFSCYLLFPFLVSFLSCWFSSRLIVVFVLFYSSSSFFFSFSFTFVFHLSFLF